MARAHAAPALASLEMCRRPPIPMPELPEVEIIRRQLAPRLEGRAIAEIEILDPRWTQPRAPGEIEAALRGAVIERVERAGKYLIWALSGDRHLLMHLR